MCGPRPEESADHAELTPTAHFDRRVCCCAFPGDATYAVRYDDGERDSAVAAPDLRPEGLLRTFQRTSALRKRTVDPAAHAPDWPEVECARILARRRV